MCSVMSDWVLVSGQVGIRAKRIDKIPRRASSVCCNIPRGRSMCILERSRARSTAVSNIWCCSGQLNKLLLLVIVFK